MSIGDRYSVSLECTFIFLKKGHSVNVTCECLDIFDVSALELHSKRSTKIFRKRQRSHDHTNRSIKLVSFCRHIIVNAENEKVRKLTIYVNRILQIYL